MTVYCLFECIPYEGAMLLGIYLKKEDAKAELTRMKIAQETYRLYTYTIEEIETK